MTIDGRQTWIEEDLGWKMTQDKPFMEVDLEWKTQNSYMQRNTEIRKSTI